MKQKKHLIVLFGLFMICVGFGMFLLIPHVFIWNVPEISLPLLLQPHDGQPMTIFMPTLANALIGTLFLCSIPILLVVYTFAGKTVERAAAASASHDSVTH
jgi:hypothetical protein